MATRPAPPSLRPFWITFVVIAVVLLVVVVVAGARGPDPAGGAGSVRVAYDPQELSAAVASQVSLGCASHRLSICTSLGNAAAYRLPGPGPGSGPGLIGPGSRYGGSGLASFPSARCLRGVDADNPSSTCLVYAANGMPAGPVTATLVVTTTPTGWFGDEDRLTSFLTVS